MGEPPHLHVIRCEAGHSLIPINILPEDGSGGGQRGGHLNKGVDNCVLLYVLNSFQRPDSFIPLYRPSPSPPTSPHHTDS